MATVTISGSYGAGASRVGEEVAARLGFRLVDRLIPASVAERLAVPLAQVLDHDERLVGGFSRFLARSAAAWVATGSGSLPPGAFTEEAIKAQTEDVIRQLAHAGQTVIVGRAGALVLGERPDVLHVRLDGPVGRRLRQAMRILGLKEAEARRALEQTDRARRVFIRHFYGADWRDPSLYHLVIDSTAIAISSCVEVVVTAARARLQIA